MFKEDMFEEDIVHIIPSSSYTPQNIGSKNS
jgi:hypothetical protein